MTDLAALPVRDGFRQRGMEMTRIETFTDAAFAFALTLLVVSLDVPSSYDALLTALRGVPAFALSAALLMIFWSGHNTWSRRYGLDDAITIILSCLLVFTVLVYVYPLRFMFGAMLAWLGYNVDLPLAPGGLMLDEPSNVNTLFIVYGIGFIAMCGSIVLLNLHAWRLRERLELNELELYDTKAEIGAWLIVGSTGVLSIIIAITTPPTWGGLPGWAYALLGIIMPIYGSTTGKRRRALLDR